MLDAITQRGCLPIGIDFGAAGVRLLQLRHRAGRLSLVAATRIETGDSEFMSDDTPGALDSLLDEIQRRIASGGFVGRACSVALDDRRLRIRSIRQIAMPEDEADRAIRLDAWQRLGFNDGAAFEADWIRAGEIRQNDRVNDEIILVGVERAPIERLIFGLAARGLRPESVEPGFMAAGRCMSTRYRRASDQAVVRVLVDIGQESTGVTLLRGKHVVFHKPLEIGGARMTRAAAERLGLEEDTVRDLRRQRKMAHLANREGSPDIEYRVDRAIFEAVRPIMDEIAQEVALCLRYYSVTFRGARPERCQIIGGEAGEPRLASFLEDALHVPSEVGDPLMDVDMSAFMTKTSRELSPPEWAVSMGLSVRRLHEQYRRKDRRSDRVAEAEPAPAVRTERKAA